MAETPKKPNMSPPKKPAGQSSNPSQGNFNELTKTLRDIRDMQAADMKERKDDDVFQRKLMVAEQVEQLHMIGIMKKVEKNIEKNTERIEKKFDEDAKRQTEQNKLAKEQLKKSGGNSESSEDEKEGKDEEKKRWKAFADSIKKGFGVGVDKGKGFFKGLWDMIKKFKTVLLVLGLGTLLANIKVGDLKKTWIKVKEFFKATKEFLTPMAEWGKDTFFPATMTLFFETMDNLTRLFDNLTKDFKGFMSKGWIGKTEAIFLALADIGHFVGSFLGSVLNWTMQLLGYDGEITKDIKNWMSTHFGPDLSSSIVHLFTTVAGGFAIMRVLGMSPMLWMGRMGKFLWGSIRLLFSTIGLALTPIGLGLTLGSMAVLFSDEILRGVERIVGSLRVGFSNVFTDINNALAETSFGKYFLKLNKREKLPEFNDEVATKLYRKKQQNEIAELEKTIAAQEKWKELSALPEQIEGKGRRTQEMMQQLGHTDEFRSQEEVKLKAQKSYLAKKKKDLAGFESLWSSQLGLPATDNPQKPAFVNKIQKMMPGVGDTVGSGMGDAVESSGRLLDKLLGRKTIGHEGYSEKAYPDAGGLSIGHGFHLSKKNAADVLKKADISKSLEDLMSGKETITRDEAKRLVDVERGFFTNVSKKWIGEDHWAKMNYGQRQALFDMSYNMGAGFYKEGNWPDLKKSIIANDNAGIARGIMLNKKGDGPSKYSLDVGASRYQANIMALQRDSLDLAPAIRKDSTSGYQPMIVDQSTTSSDEILINGRGRRYDSDRSGAREYFRM